MFITHGVYPVAPGIMRIELWEVRGALVPLLVLGFAQSVIHSRMKSAYVVMFVQKKSTMS